MALLVVGNQKENAILAGISRAAKVSESWLRGYVNNKYEPIPKEVAAKN